MNGSWKITHCGGGNLTHAQAAWSARKGHLVHVYTRNPEACSRELCAHYFDGDARKVSWASVSNFSGIIESRYFKEGIAWGAEPFCQYARFFLGEETLTLDFFCEVV